MAKRQKAPTATLSVNPTTVQAGTGALLAWSTANADAVTINQGIGAVAKSGTRAILPPATTAYILTAKNAAGAVTRSATITVSAAPPPPPEPPPPVVLGEFGPEARTMPSGAIDVAPGANLDALIAAYPTGVFWLRAGAHPAAASLAFRTGQRFVGELGQYFDGSNWYTTEKTAAVFRIHNERFASDVRLENLTFRRMPQRAIHLFNEFAPRVTVDHCHIADCFTGIELGTFSTLSNSIIERCIGDPTSLDPRANGGAYSSYMGKNITVDHNLMRFCGAETKLVMGADHVFRRNEFEDQPRGVWCDGDNVRVLVEDNIGRRLAIGSFFEISAYLTQRRNKWYACDTATFISTSKHVTIDDDEAIDCWRSFEYFVNGPAIGRYQVVADLADVVSRNCKIKIGPRSGSFANSLQCSNDTDPLVAERYLNGSKGLYWIGSQYTVPNPAAAYWVWGQQMQTFAQWQGRGQDLTGTVASV